MPAGLRKRKSRSPTNREPPSGNGTRADVEPAARTPALFRHAAVNTWPKKIAAAVLGALLASAASYFLGVDFWRNVEKKIGTAGAPVQITTITDIDRFNTDVVHIPEFVVSRPISEVPPPPNGDSFEGRYSWARKMGGVDATGTLFRMVVAGKDAAPVVLQGLRVKVVDRRPPPKGALLSYFGLGAPQSVRYIQIDLNKDPPTWDYIGPKGEPEEHFPLRVTASETEVFDVQAFGTRGDTSWYLELEYTAEGEQGTARIDDAGKPFRTTEARVPGQGVYGWLDGRWQSTSQP